MCFSGGVKCLCMYSLSSHTAALLCNRLKLDGCLNLNIWLLLGVCFSLCVSLCPVVCLFLSHTVRMENVKLVESIHRVRSN